MAFLLLAVGCKAQAQQFKTHAVKRGETLESVARLYQVTPGDILKYNKELSSGKSLRPNTILVIPISGNRTEVYDRPREVTRDTTKQQEPLGFQTHRVRKKETLFSISRRYEIPEEIIKRYNPELYSRTLQRGMVLRIPRYPAGWEPGSGEEETELITYEVQPKETRWSIAYKFNITVDSLLKLNPQLPSNTSYLAAGEQLKLPKPPGSDVEQKDTQLYVSYTVPPKKTLFSLSQEYGIPREEILRLNPEIVERGNLQEGMVLRLPEKKRDTAGQGSAFVYYEVLPKQTEYSLTRKLGLGYADLLSLNPQLARGLQAGMVLKIPRDKAGNLEVKNDLILETFDLRDSINPQHIPKLLVMLPFRLDRLDLEDTVHDLQDTDVEGSSSEVEYGYLPSLHSIGERQGGRCGLVQHPLHVQAGDGAGGLGGLPLYLVEMGRHGHNDVGDLLSEEFLGPVLHLLKYHGGYLLGGEGPAIAYADNGITLLVGDYLIGYPQGFALQFLVPSAHKTLDAGDGVPGVGDGLSLGDYPDKSVSGRCEGNNRRHDARSLAGLYHHGIPALGNCHAGIGRSQVYADSAAQNPSLSSIGQR